MYMISTHTYYIGSNYTINHHKIRSIVYTRDTADL